MNFLLLSIRRTPSNGHVKLVLAVLIQWLSIKWTPLSKGHLEFVLAILWSFSLTLYKAEHSLKQAPRGDPCHFQSFSLTYHKTDTSLKRIPRVGPCCSSVIFQDFL